MGSIRSTAAARGGLAPRHRLRTLLAAGLVTGVLAGAIAPGTPAGADVTDLTGAGAFGASVEASVIGVVNVGPTTLVPVTLPGAGGGPITNQLASIVLPPGPLAEGEVLETGLVTASTEGGSLGSHQGFSTSTATIADATVLGIADVLSATVIESTCTSNGDGSTGSATFVDLAILGQPVINGAVAPNTTISLLNGAVMVTLNEQTVVNTPGVETSITVNAIHVTANVADLVTADVILSQSRCRAAGPDVLITPTAPAGPPAAVVANPTFTG